MGKYKRYLAELTKSDFLSKTDKKRINMAKNEMRVRPPKVSEENPPLEGRLAYLEHKLKKIKTPEEIDILANKTDGFSFAQLKEFLVSSQCLKHDEDQVIQRLRTNLEGAGMMERSNFKEYMDEVLEEGVSPEIEKKLKSGLGNFVVTFIELRKNKNIKDAKEVQKNIKKELGNDFNKVMNMFGDPDKDGADKVIKKWKEFLKTK